LHDDQAKHLDDLLRLVPDTYLWVDAAARVLRVAGGGTTAFGLPAEQLTGRSLHDLEVALSVVRAIQRALASRRPESAEWVSRTFDSMLAGEARLYPTGDEVLIVHRDITDRRKAEMASAAEKERMAVTLRSIGDGVVSTDREERVVLMNPAAEALLGVTQDEAKGLPIEDVLGSGHVDSWGGVRPMLELVDSDGRVRSVLVQFAPVLQHGQLLGAVYALRDVTDEHVAESERLRASKLESVGLLAGGIAHDFNNLLAAIQGNVSVIRQMVDDGEVREMLDDVDTATRRAAGLTRQLLTFAAGGAPVKAVGSVEEIVREAVDFGMHGSNVLQEYKLSERLHPVEVDRGQIAQVLQNLVINACQAMPSGGRLVVRATNDENLPRSLNSVPGPWVCISIEDEGVGIPERDLGRIFDPYFTTKDDGTGLGLATAYAIVRKHGGFMTVDSTLGVGSTFAIYLQAAPNVPAAPDADRDFGHDGPLPMFHGRALVVDDDAALRSLASRILKALGLEVVVFADGQDGIAAYREALDAGRRFDIVLLDLTVPGGIGGREAVIRILAMDAEACCVATSGYFTDPVLARFQDYGFRGRLEKPYGVYDVVKAIKGLLPMAASGRPQ
jgi:two-component system cell cycle sensor histidine kinase/response regulator CckA